VTDFFQRVDAWETALGLFAAMFAAWAIGRWHGRHLASQGEPASAGKLEDASRAILGLLLAFTFSLALGKNDHRREALVEEANAMESLHTCAVLLPDPVGPELRGVLRDYAKRRLEFGYLPPDRVTEPVLRDFAEMHVRMTDLIRRALRDGTPIATPLTNSLNAVMASQAMRLSAVRDRLPWSVVALLLIAAVAATFFSGRQHSASRSDVVGSLSFIVLVCLIVYITLDLNQPSRGIIRVSQAPLAHLIENMDRDK